MQALSHLVFIQDKGLDQHLVPGSSDRLENARIEFLTVFEQGKLIAANPLIPHRLFPSVMPDAEWVTAKYVALLHAGVAIAQSNGVSEKRGCPDAMLHKLFADYHQALI
ncbi:hypothetical protein [Noviherbaspirillum sp. Root189]|uniref:hypothetical protein n=1 Tax=Noviherbaspirillum sp. Root189 TaxID=1736487 RepID=UPI001F1CC71D|nr:hypothetical protein [Noviherbaspirillum sp. Root189]